MVQIVTTARSDLNRVAAAELRAELARRDMTTTEAADIIGVLPRWLSRRLNGSIRMTLDDLELISTKLGVPVVELINPRRDVA